jgi:hypothetical protein
MQHPLHRSVMDTELTRNRTDAPLFNVVVAQNLCLQF